MSNEEQSTASCVTLFGGAGFLGRYVAQTLLDNGWRVRIALRNPNALPAELQDKVEVFTVNTARPASINEALQGASAAVNMIGILAPNKQQTFNDAHYWGARNIADGVKKAGLHNFVHVSALGSDAASQSLYAQSKNKGEQAVLSLVPHAVIARPSIMFGPGDNFLNRFAEMTKNSPVIPLIGNGETVFQPVYVQDVADMIAAALAGKARLGTVYELGGSERWSFAELLRYIGEVTGRSRMFMPVSFPVARAMAWGLEGLNALCFGQLPTDLMLTRDQVILLQQDNVVSEEAQAQGRTLEGLGLIPAKLRDIVPEYIDRY